MSFVMVVWRVSERSKRDTIWGVQIRAGYGICVYTGMEVHICAIIVAHAIHI